MVSNVDLLSVGFCQRPNIESLVSRQLPRPQAITSPILAGNGSRVILIVMEMSVCVFLRRDSFSALDTPMPTAPVMPARGGVGDRPAPNIVCV